MRNLCLDPRTNIHFQPHTIILFTLWTERGSLFFLSSILHTNMAQLQSASCTHHRAFPFSKTLYNMVYIYSHYSIIMTEPNRTAIWESRTSWDYGKSKVGGLGTFSRPITQDAQNSFPSQGFLFTEAVEATLHCVSSFSLHHKTSLAIYVSVQWWVPFP